MVRTFEGGVYIGVQVHEIWGHVQNNPLMGLISELKIDSKLEDLFLKLGGVLFMSGD